MSNFNSAHQEEKDGPLTKSVRQRLNKFRQLGYTLSDIGEALGFSGPFISQLLNEKKPARIRSVHVPELIKTLEEAEAEEGLTKKNKSKPTDASALSLEELMNAIIAKGFNVSVTPKTTK